MYLLFLFILPHDDHFIVETDGVWLGIKNKKVF
jgi:hypothetical protein